MIQLGARHVARGSTWTPYAGPLMPIDVRTVYGVWCMMYLDEEKVDTCNVRLRKHTQYCTM